MQSIIIIISVIIYFHSFVFLTPELWLYSLAPPTTF